MPREYRFASRRRETYRQHTHRPLNALLFIGPLLLVFHIGASRYGTGLLAPLWMRTSLEFFGASGTCFPPVFIVIVLLLQHVARRDPWKFQPAVLGGMVLESVAWTAPLVVISRVTGQLAISAGAPGAGGEEVFQQVLVALGAGIYEEFIFRLLLISLTLFIFVDVLGLKRDPVTLGAIAGAAVLFSFCHFTRGQIWGPESFPWSRFIFLTIAGTIWGVVYAVRGIGIATGSHILWDLYVVWMRT